MSVVDGFAFNGDQKSPLQLLARSRKSQYYRTVRRLGGIAVPGQEELTADDVGVKVSVLLGYRITDAAKVTYAVQSYGDEIYGAEQVALREAARGSKADEVLKNIGP